MPQQKNHFKVLDALDSEEIATQRQLAEHAGISLGSVNYVLKLFLEKGLVKIGNFTKNPHKLGYVYLLTPKGIDEKSRLAVRFVTRKLDEYNCLQERIARHLSAFDQKGAGKKERIVFLGPEMIGDFVKDVVQSHHLNLLLVKCLKESGQLSKLNKESFDAVLLFTGKNDNLAKVAAETGVDKEKLHRLW